MIDMKKEPKKMTVGELIAKQYLEDAKKSLNLLDLSSITSAAKIAQETLDEMKKPFENMKRHLSSPVYTLPPMEYMRKPEYEMIDILYEIKDQGAQRKKEVGLFIFNVKEKTIERDTDTRSFKYKFIDKGMNFKLVKNLVDKEGFRQTRHIKTDLGSKSNEAVRKKIGEINKKIKDGLRLENGFKFIIGESGAGYKINPELKIKVIEE